MCNCKTIQSSLLKCILSTGYLITVKVHSFCSLICKTQCYCLSLRCAIYKLYPIVLCNYISSVNPVTVDNTIVCVVIQCWDVLWKTRVE